MIKKRSSLLYCQHCKRFFIPCKYNGSRQHYCTNPECQAASKKASNDNWRARNRQYFHDAIHVVRAQKWRFVRWVKDSIAPSLQDSIISKALDVIELMPEMPMKVIRGLVEASVEAFNINRMNAGLSPA